MRSIIILFFPCLLYGQMNEGKLLSENKYYELKYTQTDKVITLDVGLKGSKKKFMLDSGAPVFISDSIQNLYNFPIIQKARLRDASNKKSEVLIVRIDTLIVGPFVFINLPALVLNYKNSPLQCADFVGNFGSNALRFLTIQFDIQKERVTLTDNRQLLKMKPTNWKPATIDGQSNFFFPVQINNNYIDTVHFDTGDGVLYNMLRKSAQKLSELYPEEVIHEGFGVTSIGALGIPENSEQIILKPAIINFHNSVIKQGLINTTEGNVSRMGRYLLNYGVLTLDYPSKQYTLETYNHLSLPPYFSFGFTPISEGGKVFAGTVWEKSEAAENGMESGNEILSVNGVAFIDLSICNLESVLKNALALEDITLVFRNTSGKEKKIVLHKKLLIE